MGVIGRQRWVGSILVDKSIAPSRLDGEDRVQRVQFQVPLGEWPKGACLGEEDLRNQDFVLGPNPKPA